MYFDPATVSCLLAVGRSLPLDCKETKRSRTVARVSEERTGRFRDALELEISRDMLDELLNPRQRSKLLDIYACT